MASHYVRGSVRQAGLPVARTVYVYSMVDGTLLGSAVSSASDGSWSIQFDSADQVFVVCTPPAGYSLTVEGPFTPIPLG